MVRKGTRHNQVQDILRKNRGLVLGPWFRPVLRSASMPRPRLEPIEKRQFALLKRGNPHAFDSDLRRVGFVERGSTRYRNGVSIPVSETRFSEWLGARKGGIHRRRALLKHPRRFEKAPYVVGVNAILELTDGKGRPTHILMIKRPPIVAEFPNFFDFAAGLLREKSKPVSLLKERIRKETGIPKSRLRVMGRGFKYSKTGEAFAMYLDEKAANYDFVHVVRANITPEEFKARFARLVGDWKPSAFAVIPRTPEAIRKFLQENDQVLMPEVLRLYARELALFPGKRGKKS